MLTKRIETKNFFSSKKVNVAYIKEECNDSSQA